GGNRTGSDNVGRDPAGSQLQGQVLGQHLDGAFHYGIGAAARIDDARDARRQVDDVAAVVDQRQQLLRQEEHALQVNVVEGVQVRFRRLLDAVVVRRARVVDQEVEAVAPPGLVQRAFEGLDELVERPHGGRVELQRDRSASVRLDGG